MEIGMMWFDNDPKTDLPQKVNRAAAYYRKKFGEVPTMCMINPKMVSGEQVSKCSLEIKTNQSILHHHLWLGVAVEKQETAGS